MHSDANWYVWSISNARMSIPTKGSLINSLTDQFIQEVTHSMMPDPIQKLNKNVIIFQTVIVWILYVGGGGIFTSSVIICATRCWFMIELNVSIISHSFIFPYS